jgi:hypothetical protein
MAHVCDPSYLAQKHDAIANNVLFVRPGETITDSQVSFATRFFRKAGNDSGRCGKGCDRGSRVGLTALFQRSRAFRIFAGGRDGPTTSMFGGAGIIP